MIVTLNQEHHEYLVPGESNPLSVTEILKLNGLIHTSRYTEFARSRGSAFHFATHLLDSGLLDWGTVHPTIHPRLTQYQKFRKENPGMALLHSEVSMWHPNWKYCGTADKVFQMNVPVVVDLKSGKMEDWSMLQLGGYGLLAKATWGFPQVDAMILEVSDSGCRPIWFRGRDQLDNENYFLAMLATLQWKLRHGYMDKEEKNGNGH